MEGVVVFLGVEVEEVLEVVGDDDGMKVFFSWDDV
jgi:hypothetical protein